MSKLRFRLSALLLVFAGVAGTANCGSCDDTGINANHRSGDGGALSDGGPTDADIATDGTSRPDGSDAASCPTKVCGGACCRAAQVCYGGNCVSPGADCEGTAECPDDDICEPTIGKCLPRDGVDACEYVPPVGEFTPKVDCSWPPDDLAVDSARDEVVVAPVVGNLTDDNDDGSTNTDDIPDIAFLSRTHGCCNKPATLRIISGQCNDDGSTTEIASVNKVQMINDGALALGDLTGNGVPELVTISYDGPVPSSSGMEPAQGVTVLTRAKDDGSQWDVLWRTTEAPIWKQHISRGGAVVNLADLDGDGNPEVIVGNVVLNGQTGELKWDGNQTSDGKGGIGNNAFLGPASAVGDIDLDGDQEVAAGNTLYDYDGAVLWTYEYTSSASGCDGDLPCDGFNGMANFDDDPEGEVVIVRRGEVFIINHDGSLLWKQEVPWEDCKKGGARANESGPPTIADFDGDGRPEIGTAGADFYAVMDMDCDPQAAPGGSIQASCDDTYEGVLWAKSNEDCSSRATASSVFDFEGDGKAEMVYADEDTFRIRAGADGALLYEDTSHSSNTRIEMPLVADVDNDGNSEIVIPSPTDKAIKIWADSQDNWVRTRRIWNQHAYSVTNVTENGQIPAHPDVNWQNPRLNNFRQNRQPGNVFDAPDLSVEDIELAACSQEGDAQVNVTVANRGALGEPAGVTVEIVADHNGSTTPIGTTQTASRLLPGQSETVSVSWDIPADWWDDGFELRAGIDPDGSINECDEDNNELGADSDTLSITPPGLEVTAVEVDDGACGVTHQLTVEVSVENTDADPIPANTLIRIEAVSGNSTETIAEVRTSTELAPGDTEQFTDQWAVPASFLGVDFDVVATVDPDGAVFECAQKNKESAPAACHPEG